MEVTERQIQSVHVLRHSFRPSEHLAVALERFARPGVPRPRSFLYATHTVVIDFNRHSIHDVNFDIDAASADFLKQTRTKVELGGVNNPRDKELVVARKLASNALRVALFPKDSTALNRMLEPFTHLPNDSSKPPSPTMGHFLYADIPASVVGGLEDVAHATASLVRDLESPASARLYVAQPSGIDRQVL